MSAVKHISTPECIFFATKQVARRYLKPYRQSLEHYMQFYSEFIRPGDLCFDVGANIGNRVGVFLELGARVVAVEPLEFCMDKIQKRYIIEYINGQLICIQGGVDSQIGRREIFFDKQDTGISSMSEDWINAHKDLHTHVSRTASVVDVTTLDQLIKDHGEPSFCKIDTEGFEHNILSGLSKPIRALSFEYNPTYLPTVYDCIDVIETLGEYEYNYSTTETMQMALAGWVSAERMKKLVESQLSQAAAYGDIYARVRSKIAGRIG